MTFSQSSALHFFKKLYNSVVYINSGVDVLFQTIRRFFGHITKYREYILYSTRSNLKAEVSNTFFGYIWWLLDPLLNMVIYTIVVVFIMRRGVPNFPVFVFCALLPWKWLSSCISTGADSLKMNAGVLKQIYLPKFIPSMISMNTNMIKFLFGLIILVGLCFIYRLYPTWHYFEIIPVIITSYLIIYSITLLVTHLGALFMDLKTILGHLLRLWFYLSPGFWSINNLPEKYKQFWWWANPAVTLIESCRNIFMFGKSPYYYYLLYWTCVSLVLISLGLKILYRYDKNYTKVF